MLIASNPIDWLGIEWDFDLSLLALWEGRIVDNMYFFEMLQQLVHVIEVTSTASVVTGLAIVGSSSTKIGLRATYDFVGRIKHIKSVHY